MEMGENVHMFHDDEEVGGGSDFVLACPAKKIRLDCSDNIDDASVVTTFESSKDISSNGDDDGNRFEKQQESSAAFENLGDGDGESENGVKILSLSLF